MPYAGVVDLGGGGGGEVLAGGLSKPTFLKETIRQASVLTAGYMEGREICLKFTKSPRYFLENGITSHFTLYPGCIF